MTASERRWLAAILAVALALRVAVALLWPAPLTGDAADYHRLATGLAQGRGYVDTAGSPTAWRPPVYPAFLAALYRTVGDGPRAVALAQAAVGTATVAAVAALTTALLGGTAGLIAAVLVAVDAAQLALTSRRLSEGLFTLLLALLLLLAVRVRARLAEGQGAWLGGAAAGVVAAAATLTRGVFVAFPLLLALALVADAARAGGRAPRTRAAVGAALVLLAAYGAALAPWALRNARALGEPVPVATQAGITLYMSWFPVDGTVFGAFPEDDVTRAAAGLSEAAQSRHFVAATTRRLAETPGIVPRLLALKALYLAAPLDWEVLPGYGGVNPSYLLVAAWAAAFLLALGRGRRALAWPLWLPLVYVVLTSLVFYGSPRMRAPVDPLLAALAAGGIVELAARRGTGRAAAAVVATGAGALAVAALAVPLKAVALGGLRALGLWRR